MLQKRCSFAASAGNEEWPPRRIATELVSVESIYHFKFTCRSRVCGADRFARPLSGTVAWDLSSETGGKRPEVTILPVHVHYSSSTLSVHRRKKLRKILTGFFAGKGDESLQETGDPGRRRVYNQRCKRKVGSPLPVAQIHTGFGAHGVTRPTILCALHPCSNKRRDSKFRSCLKNENH